MQRHCYALKNTSDCGLLQPDASFDDESDDILMSSTAEAEEVNMFFVLH